MDGTNLWLRLVDDIEAKVASLIERRRMTARTGNRARVISSDPGVTYSDDVMALRGAMIRPGDDVLTLDLGGGEVVIGALLKDTDTALGLPPGGEPGEKLTKAGTDDYHTEWGGWERTGYLGATVTRNTTLNLAIPELCVLDLPAGTAWVIDHVLFTGMAGGGDGIKVSMTGAAGVTVRSIATGHLIGPPQRAVVSGIVAGIAPNAYFTETFNAEENIGIVRISTAVQVGDTPGYVLIGFNAAVAGQTAHVEWGSYAVARRAR